MCLDFNAHASASELQELISVSVILFRVGFRELKMHEKIKHATIPMHPNKLLKFKYSRTVTLKRLANCFGLVILKTWILKMFQITIVVVNKSFNEFFSGNRNVAYSGAHNQNWLPSMKKIHQRGNYVYDHL